MKKIFFSICALAAIVSCSKSEVIDAPGAGQAISFDTYVGQAAVTKATSVDTKEALQGAGFMAHSFNATDNTYHKSFNNEYVSDGDSGNWSYGSVEYWPNYALDFVAYGKTATVTESDDHKTITYDVPAVVADQKDLIVAPYQKGKTYESGVVEFEFVHMLSRIGYSVNVIGSNAVVISDVTLSGSFHTKGDVDLYTATPTIVGNGDAANTAYKLFAENQSYTFTPAEGANTNIFVGEEANRYMMIIPGDADDYKVSVTYQIGSETAVTKDFELGADFKFEAGKSYDFKFTVATNAIVFSASVAEWGSTTSTPLAIG